MRTNRTIRLHAKTLAVFPNQLKTEKTRKKGRTEVPVPVSTLVLPATPKNREEESRVFLPKFPNWKSSDLTITTQQESQ